MITFEKRVSISKGCWCSYGAGYREQSGEKQYQAKVYWKELKRKGAQWSYFRREKNIELDTFSRESAFRVIL